jgi:hypothetical protein
MYLCTYETMLPRYFDDLEYHSLCPTRANMGGRTVGDDDTRRYGRHG